MRHPNEHNKLAVDPDTAWIIEKIFDLAVHGAGAGKITKILIQEKIPTSGYINYKKYGLFSKFYDNASAEKSYTWTISIVRGILSDETYIGNSVHGKQTNVSYKNKKRFASLKVNGSVLKIHTKQLSQKMFSIRFKSRLQAAGEL